MKLKRSLPRRAPVVASGSVAHRILRVLAERWPVTTEDLAVALRLRAGQVDLEVKRLAAQGKVTVEKLGEKTYVALRGDARRLPQPAPKDPHDPAFG